MNRDQLEAVIRRQLTFTVTAARNGRIDQARLNATVNTILNAASEYADQRQEVHNDQR